VDLQERHQLDVARAAAGVAKVKARTRPWRIALAAVAAVLCALGAEWARRDLGLSDFGLSPAMLKVINVACAVAFLLFASTAAIGLSNKVRAGLEPVLGSAHAGIMRYAVLLVGIFVLLLVALELGRVSIHQLLLGGAVTGVLLGIAAQQSLANLFAGLVLLFAHPFRVGDEVRFRSSSLGGVLEGKVIDISLTYVRLETADGQLLLPNSIVLAAAVGPRPVPVAKPDEPGHG
jgi:small-conductance mechanosensitive channel